MRAGELLGVACGHRIEAKGVERVALAIARKALLAIVDVVADQFVEHPGGEGLFNRPGCLGKDIHQRNAEGAMPQAQWVFVRGVADAGAHGASVADSASAATRSEEQPTRPRPRRLALLALSSMVSWQPTVNVVRPSKFCYSVMIPTLCNNDLTALDGVDQTMLFSNPPTPKT